MKKDFRHSMTWLHTWAGLILCWVLYFIFITGTLGYFDTEIDHWMKPELKATTPQELQNDLQLGIGFLQQKAPNAERWFITPANNRNSPQLRVSWRYPRSMSKTHKNGSTYLDNQSGEEVKARETAGGQSLYRMHYRLHYIPRDVGFKLVGIFTLVMFIALVTGVIAHRKLFKDFFTFRPQKGKAAWLDLHNLTSIASLPFQLMITYSGLIFVITTWMPLVAISSYDFDTKSLRKDLNQLRGRIEVKAEGVQQALPSTEAIVQQVQQQWAKDSVRFIEVKHPNDRNAHIIFNSHSKTVGAEREQLVFKMQTGEIQAHGKFESTADKVSDTFIALHEGLFAGTWLRWLYFFSGLLGALMVATGAVYYSQKRARVNQSPSRAQRSIEVLNIGTLVGLPLAIGVYFLANRLLPVDMLGRSSWELHSLFISWGLCFAVAAWRPAKQCWIELLVLTAAVFMAIPMINATTTDTGLFNSFAQGDWVRFYFDLGAIGFGLVSCIATFKLRQKLSPATQQQAGHREEIVC